MGSDDREPGEVVEGIDRRDGTTYAGLALNEQGYDRLRAAGLDEVRFAVAATESFSKRNSNLSVDEAVAAAEKILKERVTCEAANALAEQSIRALKGQLN